MGLSKVISFIFIYIYSLTSSFVVDADVPADAALGIEAVLLLLLI